jgi:hypothetical protein
VSHASAAVPCDISLQQVENAARSHGVHVSGVVVAAGDSTCVSSDDHKPPEIPFVGTPPLLFHGSPPVCPFAPCENGSVLMTASTGPLVVVPIFWNPTGFPMASSYKDLITTYLGDVAKDSGHTHNVFSVADEYSGTNGQIQYNVQLGPVLNDTDPITSDCMVNAADTSAIYADDSGYSACVSDATLRAEVEKVIGANSFPHGLTHIFVLYLPKHVESCFLPGQTLVVDGGQACTINHEPTAAFCAYHNEDPSRALYANMAYPIYHSPVINGGDFLTQEEFSNNVFNASGGTAGCVQGLSAE